MPIRLVTESTNAEKLYTQGELDKTVEAERKSILKHVNWFTAHLLLSYRKVDKSTKKHIDRLYLEFINRLKARSK